MLQYTYKIIEKHGFKYFDTSQFYYDKEYFISKYIDLEYNRVSHRLDIIHLKYNKTETYYFNENSTDDELDNILKNTLRKYKLKTLLK